MNFTADPANGRFISQDSYRGELTDSGQWHLYVYCANNPINYTDSSGHKKKKLPRSGEKVWFCYEATKAILRDKIAPYFKGKSAKEGFKEWIVEQFIGDYFNLCCEKEDINLFDWLSKKTKKAPKVSSTFTVLNLAKKSPIVTVGLASYEIGCILYTGSLHEKWKKIDKFYKKHLYGSKAKDSKRVFFCTQIVLKRHGQDMGFLPTKSIEMHLKKHNHE